ncbi:MAG: Ig-like domain-containing protein, partial [Patescibacteria group bacterium]
MTYPALYSGSPLIPLDIVAAVIGAFIISLVAVYFLIHFHKKEAPVRTKIKRLVFVGSGLFILTALAGTALAAYWLLPTPHVIRADPRAGETDYPLSRKIEIVFDRPVSRALMEKSITPEVPGVWVFENSTYRTHLLRRVAFYPQESLTVATEYTIALKNITNVIRKSTPYDYELKFKTQPSPGVKKVSPGNNQKDVGADTPILIYLSAPDGQVSQFQFELAPHLPLEISLDQTKTLYTLTPKSPLKQGTRYQLLVKKSDVRRNLKSDAIVETGPLSEIYRGYFTTKIPVGIDSVFPTGDAVTSRQPITIRFTKEMDEASIKRNFSIQPPVAGSSLLIDHVIYVFTPKKYEFATEYTIRLAKEAESLDGSFLESDLATTFTTLGHVRIASSFPTDGSTGVRSDEPLAITFDQEVNPASAESLLAISPPTGGVISWEGKTLIFTPAKSWQKDTLYTAVIKAGVESLDGLDSITDNAIIFSTVQSVFKLPVPIYLQQHPLSCELAALRMALAFRQIAKTEEELLVQVGYDPLPRRGNVWGDPYETFVGSIDGKQMSTGYGVYWPPIARVANLYTQAREFSGISTTDILKEVEKGNPVIIWTYSRSGIPTFWFDGSGEKIFAASGEHTVVIVGFVGPVDHPSQVIVNDPLLGQIYWSLSEFTQKASLFANSGV